MSRLRIRIFLFVLLLCAVLLAVALLLVQRAALQQRQSEAAAQLPPTLDAVRRRLTAERERQLLLAGLIADRSDAARVLDAPVALAETRGRLDLDLAVLLDAQLQPLLSDPLPAPALPWGMLSPRAADARWVIVDDALWLLTQVALAPNQRGDVLRLGLARRLRAETLAPRLLAPELLIELHAVDPPRLLLRVAGGAPALAGDAIANETVAAAAAISHREDAGEIASGLQLTAAHAARHPLADYGLLRWQLLSLALLTLLAAALGAVLIGNSITRPLNALVRYMRGVSAGDTSAPAPVETRGEVGAMAREFAFMLSAIAQREASIRHLAFQDGLTGLANRHQFQQLIGDTLKLGPEYRFLVMVADLDRFREINDTLGHAAGDKVLKQVALRLQHICRPQDVLARLSADEFGVLLRDVPPTEVIAQLQRYREPFRDPFSIDGIALDLSATLGAAVHPEHGEGASVLLQRAEIALYQAKSRRTGLALYTAELDRHTLRRLTLMAELRAAIERDQLELYVQPKLDIRSWRIIGVECLVRWVHPDYGFVPPDEFIPLAEQTGTIRELTDWILQASMDWAQRWREAGYLLKVAVNLSTVDLLDPQLTHRIAAWMAERALPFDSLILEVTESAVMEDPERSLPVLSQLRDLGIALSIDDFGTGYSSMAQLKRLPVEELKIDKSFVFDVADNPDDAVIVRATIELGHNMDLRVVAEGVESERALEWLSHFGCDMAQGYHLSRPIPARELLGWLGSSPYLVESRSNALDPDSRDDAGSAPGEVVLA